MRLVARDSTCATCWKLAGNTGTRSNTFSGRGELTQMAFTGAGASLNRSFLYDGSSRIAEVQHGPPEDRYSRTHSYDSRDRLQAYRDTYTWTETIWESYGPYDDCEECLVPVDITHVDTLRAAAYAFDKLGNRTGAGIAYVAPGRHRLSTHAGESFTYDAEGNILTRAGGALGSVSYTWNALGQLAQVTGPAGTTTYGYDGFGQRVRKTVNGVTTRYLLHEGQVALELTATGGILAEYTYYPGTDRPHGMRRAGVQYFYVQDAQGNVSGLLRAGGTLVETYTYTPHGVLVAGGASGIANPHRFKGREWDAESGLYYMRARYYDPALGRFVSEDPIGLAGGLNPYLFVAGDPVNYADPSGLAPECMGHWDLMYPGSGNAFETPVWICKGGWRLDPVRTTLQAPATFFFSSVPRGGGGGLSGADAYEAFRLLGTADDAMTTAITAVPSAVAQGPFNGVKFAAISGVVVRRSLAQIARRGWSTARRHFWKVNGPGGVAPRRQVLVRDTRTGFEYTRWETMEVHHRRSLKNGGTHEFGNLDALWPTAHANVDSDRRVGYIVLKIIGGHDR